MLQKDSININFSGGLDTKNDPKQVSAGKFLVLENSVFDVGGLLKKRNGYQLITTIPGASTLTTFSDNLVTINSGMLSAYSADTKTNVNAGFIQPLSLAVQPLVRSATSQATVDVAIAGTGLCCSTWLDSDGNTYYQISDSRTGQIVVPKVVITSGTDVNATMSRIFVLGNYFVITYLATVSSAATLRMIAIPLNNPSSPFAPATISTQVSGLTAAYDGIVASGPQLLYLSWNGSDGGGAVRVAYVNVSLQVSTNTVLAGSSANRISNVFDEPNNRLWVTFYTSSANTISTAAFDQNLAPILGVTVVATSVTVNELTSSMANGVLYVFYEIANLYTYSPFAKTDFISKNSCTISGTIGTPSVVVRGVGLASKAVRVNAFNKSYMLVCYGSSFQPTYFLIDDTGNVVSKLAYSNGGGYLLNQILPGMNIAGNTIQVGYLFKDFLESIANPVGPMGTDIGVNKSQGALQIAPIYSQTGINLASFTLNNVIYNPSEIGQSLHLGAGFMWQYDGVKPVEHNFHLWPDDVSVTGSPASGSITIGQGQMYFQAVYEWTDAQGEIHRSAPSIPTGFLVVTAPANFTANRTSGSLTLTSVSSFSGLQIGQPIAGTGIATGAYIANINVGASTITMSLAATSGTSTSTIITPTTVSSVAINVPTARLTYKTQNKIRITVYQWSTTQQEYYPITSLTNPVLNDPTTDSVTITSTFSDAQILGNSLIYTTGGVIENIAAPGSNAMTLFDDRLWVVDAEDRNLLWYSKQVIENTPVEMSDLFTLYVAPTTGAQGSTGPITAIAPMDDKLVIFKSNAIYYVNGVGPDNTGASSSYSQPIFITSTVGTDNQQSIVMTPMGLMFQSNKGIWLLGRDLSQKYIGADVEEFNSLPVTSALAIPATNQVRFTLGGSKTCLMFDYYYQQWGTFSNLSAISGVIYQNLHSYLSPLGRVLQETPDLYLDESSPILLKFQTSWLKLSALQAYQRAYFFYLLGEYISPHKLWTSVEYDYQAGPSQSDLITPVNFSTPYGSGPSQDPYGQGDPYGGPGNLEQWRINLARQRCMAIRIAVEEIYDASLGVAPGAGLTLSGLLLVAGFKKNFKPMPAAIQISSGK